MKVGTVDVNNDIIRVRHFDSKKKAIGIAFKNAQFQENSENFHYITFFNRSERVDHFAVDKKEKREYFFFDNRLETD